MHILTEQLHLADPADQKALVCRQRRADQLDPDSRADPLDLSGQDSIDKDYMALDSNPGSPHTSPLADGYNYAYYNSLNRLLSE